MHHLLAIVPTWIDWGRWFIFITAGFIVKPLYDRIRGEVQREMKRQLRQERKLALKLHVKELHPKGFWHCREGACKFLRSAVGHQTGQVVQAAASAETSA